MNGETQVMPGVCPVLFRLGAVEIPAYGFFITLGILTAMALYAVEARRQRQAGDDAIILLLAALVGGTLGAKLPIWVMHFHEIIARFPDPEPILAGRTIVGGLIGGTLAVLLMRRWRHVPLPSGNLFAPGLAAGIAVGRLGCFCRGCCYGVVTSLPWGVNFGDGTHRHPTELYESLFMAGLFVYLWRARRRVTEPGRLFRLLMLAYFTFRFLIEFIRQEPRPYLGLTLAQVTAVGVVGYYLLSGRKPQTPERRLEAGAPHCT